MASALALKASCWAAAVVATIPADLSSSSSSPVPFRTGYTPLFGDGNLVRSPDGHSVPLKLDRRTGSGFVSKAPYSHGFFSASIQLPDDYTAGVVVVFYLSNADVYPHNHDEVDFELLGNRRGHGWRVQTNIYGNGSTSRGREERYILPFDPTSQLHSYAFSWTATAVIFYVDGTPIREVVRVPAMGGDFPGKPMSVYATIWDGSAWATGGGRFRVDYAYAPFAADFSSLVLRGCPAAGDGAVAECEVAVMTDERAVMKPAKRTAMRRFRRRYLIYTVCHDRVRYNGTVFSECDVTDGDRFYKWGESKRTVPSCHEDKAAATPTAVDGRPSTWPVGGSSLTCRLTEQSAGHVISIENYVQVSCSIDIEKGTLV